MELLRKIWPNLLVAVTNFPAIYAINLAIDKRDILTASVITYVASASFLSHLVENHKHGMYGIGFSPRISYFLNRLDVLGCVFVGLRFSYLYYIKYGLCIGILSKNKYLIFIYFLPFILLKISAQRSACTTKT